MAEVLTADMMMHGPSASRLVASNPGPWVAYTWMYGIGVTCHGTGDLAAPLLFLAPDTGPQLGLTLMKVYSVRGGIHLPQASRLLSASSMDSTALVIATANCPYLTTNFTLLFTVLFRTLAVESDRQQTASDKSGSAGRIFTRHPPPDTHLVDCSVGNLERGWLPVMATYGQLRINSQRQAG